MQELLAECRAQDEVLRGAGLEIWLGAEPTFTDRTSQDPHWLWMAEGGDKEDARRGAAPGAAREPRRPPSASSVPRGGSTPGEEAPRFCLGATYVPRGGAGERWLTVAPDPGVVEVNLAPAPDLVTFAEHVGSVYAAAAAAGLSPERFRWNGHAGDSGGGGQITLGGPSPERSPFFLRPRLLPSLVRYLNHHPSLSYAFAPECVGSAGAGAAPGRGRPGALRRAGRGARPAGPARRPRAGGALDVARARCSSTRPGNSHRAEVNVEKLWNPHLPGRGKMGVVELRALRMPPAPERLLALGALFRAVAARLARAPFEEPLLDWGPRAARPRLASPLALAGPGGRDGRPGRARARAGEEAPVLARARGRRGGPRRARRGHPGRAPGGRLLAAHGRRGLAGGLDGPPRRRQLGAARAARLVAGDRPGTARPPRGSR